MNYINYNDIKKELKISNLIGIGTTAYCYKLSDGTVIKIYKNKNISKYLIKEELFTKNLNQFRNVSNETFIGLDKIVLKDNDIIGYTYPYVDGKCLKSINKNNKLSDIFKNYKKVLDDTKDISDKGFILFDVHPGNIIINDDIIQIIDLDKCSFHNKNDQSTSYYGNCDEIFDNVFGYIYNKKTYEILTFLDNEIEKKYHNLKKYDYESILEFLNYLNYYLQNDDPSLADVKKKVKVKKIINDYI